VRYLIEEKEEEIIEPRKNKAVFDYTSFARLVVHELNKTSSGRQVLKKYKQSEVRDFIENYKLLKNQVILRDIANVLFVKSPQYKNSVTHFAYMPLFPLIIKPVKYIKNEKKAFNQYVEIAELLEVLNIKHEMQKALVVGFTEGAFFGYVHRNKDSFYIEPMNANICKITSVQDGVYNYSIDMLAIKKDEKVLLSLPIEIQVKYKKWKESKIDTKTVDYNFVELDAQNTICIKIDESTLDVIPPFVGSFDSIFDIDGYKQLRKDREELDNYMVLAQELPIRKDSNDNNDFAIDEKMMQFFHKMASEAVPENVGVITSPMPITPITFNKDKQIKDGVADATRDFWESIGISNLLFGSGSNSTSQGMINSIKADEMIVFAVVTQIQRWLNRYIKGIYGDLTFNVEILHITAFNKEEEYKRLKDSGTYGYAVKCRMSAILGLSPLEVTEMLKLENDILKLNEKLIPLQNSHTQNTNETESGRPVKDAKDLSDEGSRAKDKPNAI
jgi:hypothetical protein